MTSRQRPQEPNFFDMRGTSMLPTLHAGEGVKIDPEIDKNKLQAGDIIVFKDPRGNDKNIIHRIIKIRGDGYLTSGDNNRQPDDYIVGCDNILGKALTLRKGSREIPLSGGLKGMIIHRLLKIRKFCYIHFTKIPSRVSSVIDKSGCLNIFHRFVQIDIVTIKKGDETYEVILHKNKMVGKKHGTAGEWIIRFPYKYFIDRNKL